LALSGSPGQTQSPIPAPAAPNLKDPEALLAAARASNGLEGDDLKPWHLKATYDVFDPYGKPLATGVFEEWWAGKDKWKRSYTGPHYTSTEYHLPEGSAHDGDMPKDVPWPESLIAGKLIRPIDPPSHGFTSTDKSGHTHTVAPEKPTLREIGKLALSCAQIELPGPSQGVAYCFDRDSIRLRMTEAPHLQSVYNNLGTFEGRVVGREATVRFEGHPVIDIHVASLSTFQPESMPEVFVATTPLTPRPVASETRADAPIRADPQVIAGQKISGLAPAYPAWLKSIGVQGTVMLGVTITKRGDVVDVAVLEAPHRFLADAAMDAVRTWKYAPYLLDGSAVEVHTRIYISFNLGR
jgi:TonB family protein